MNSLLHKNKPAANPLMLPHKASQCVHPKLAINMPGDQYEQEADAMADRVMRMPYSQTVRPATGLIGQSLQRKCAHCEEEEKRKKPVMRKAESGNAGMAVSASFSASLQASQAAGSPLPQATRDFMENAFSADFSGVKIHADSQASEMSKGINAKAFTTGNDIYFGAGQYSPGTFTGKNLLAHELTHVVQQTGAATPHSIQRKENILHKKIVKIIAFKGQLTAQAVLSDNSVINNIRLSINTYEEPGTYIYLYDAGETYSYRTDGPGQRNGLIRWYKKDIYKEKYMDAVISDRIEVVIIEGDTTTQQANFNTMPGYIKDFLTKGEGKMGSYEAIEDTVNAAFILQSNGITEDDLLLYEIENEIHTGTVVSDSINPVDWAIGLVSKKQQKMDDALQSRAAFNEQYQLDTKNGQWYQKILDKGNWYSTIWEIQDTVAGIGLSNDIIINTFEQELKSNTQTFLSQVLLALLKIEKRFITDSVNVGVGKDRLRLALEPLKAALEQKEYAEAEYSKLQLENYFATTYGHYSGQQKIQLDEQVEGAKDSFETKSAYLLNVAGSVNFPVLNLPGFNLHALLKEKTIENQQGLLKAFIFDARQKIEKASGMINDTKYLYKADKMVKFTKDNLGIDEKAYTNALINMKVASATEDSTFEEIINIASIISIFIPGGVGLLIRMGISAVAMPIEFGKYDDVSKMHAAGLSSEEASIAGSVLAVGGAFLDAGDLAKGIVKVAGAEAKGAATVANELQAADTVARLEKGESRIGLDGTINEIPAAGQGHDVAIDQLMTGEAEISAAGVAAQTGESPLLYRLSPDEYTQALSLAFPSQYFDEAAKAVNEIGMEAAERAVRDTGFIALLRSRNMKQAGTKFHSIADSVGNEFVAANRLPPGYSFEFELTVVSGRGGSRLDVFIRNPGGEILEFDWKTTGKSALSSKTITQMEKHATQIAAPNGIIGNALSSQQSFSWSDEVRAAWQEFSLDSPEEAGALIGGNIDDFYSLLP